VLVIKGAVVAPLKEQEENTMYRNMHDTNAADTRELTDAELERVAGGGDPNYVILPLPPKVFMDAQTGHIIGTCPK
jgi:hypothetical protein